MNLLETSGVENYSVEILRRSSSYGTASSLEQAGTLACGEEIGITGNIGYTLSGFDEDGSVAWDARVRLPVKWEMKRDK